MSKMYECKDFIVTNGAFRGLRVHVKRTGNVTKPPHEITHKTLSTWVKLARFQYSSPKARRYAEAHLFHDMGSLVMDPDHPESFSFTMTSADYSAQEYVRRGEISALGEEK